MSISVIAKDVPATWIEVHRYRVHPYLILKYICYIFQFVLCWFCTLDKRSWFWDLHIYAFMHSSCLCLKRRHTLRENILKCIIFIRRKWVANICNISATHTHWASFCIKYDGSKKNSDNQGELSVNCFKYCACDAF